MAAIIISTYFRFLPSSTNSSSKTKWNLNWKAQSICCILYLPNNLTGNMGRAQSHESDAIMITKWLRTSWVLACYSLGSWKFWAWWEKKWQAISFFILMAVAPLRRENLLIRSQTIKIINLLRDVSLSLDLSLPPTHHHLLLLLLLLGSFPVDTWVSGVGGLVSVSACQDSAISLSGTVFIFAF